MPAEEPFTGVFTTDFQDVKAAERSYLNRRREENGLADLEEDPGLWGLALSGGGVRSATFGLGLLQALMGKDRMKRFDYLSTVSGGGYIGSCLSSLLSNRTDTGVEPHNSPFNGLRELDDYQDPPHTQLSVRHQIHHLRTHGEYLIPRSGLLSRDVQRALGSSLSGVGHTLILFALFFVVAVATTHLILTAVDQDFSSLAPAFELGSIHGGEGLIGGLDYVLSVLGAWYGERLVPPLRDSIGAAVQNWELLIAMGALGAFWCLAWFVRGTRLALSFHSTEVQPGDSTRAGWTPEEERESRFVRSFNFWSVLVVLVVTLGLAVNFRISEGSASFLTGLFLPLAFSIGGFALTHLLTYAAESRFALKAWRGGGRQMESRFRRSLYGSLRGACIYGAIVALGLPVLLVFLFSLSDLPLKLFLSLGALAWAYFASRKGGGPSTSQLGGWVKRPLANLAVLLFLAFAFAQVSAWLMALYNLGSPEDTWLYCLGAALVALIPFVLLGTYVDANRVSPHYFYRDRLTEAYLKTDARTRRPGDSRQGMPLTVLRDDEDLRMSELGRDNNKGPYHLIVAALNLSGSEELNRKSFLSEHFIFSREYIGSKVTGWVKTEAYRANTTRLARAMAISAAAVGSVMGRHTFGAQAFVSTLFNLRLGYWMENPWHYRGGVPERPRSRPTFWPSYLLREIFGRTSARTRLVNVSDGGHTGDNLGLLPLLRRRCSTILVSDAEADGDYTFGSLNNAVRLALTEENIRIDLDLTPIMTREETESGFQSSEGSLVEGKIHYPATPSGEKASTGRLIFLKASVSGTRVPVHVANYAKEQAAFPHQTTADQFFDDAQFEAYRALGEYLGAEAAEALPVP